MKFILKYSKAQTWQSHTHSIHGNPTDKTPPTYRPAPTESVNHKGSTKRSGYETNSITFDGRGFLPNEESAGKLFMRNSILIK